MFTYCTSLLSEVGMARMGGYELVESRLRTGGEHLRYCTRQIDMIAHV